jgi:hypothetical protein
MRTRQREAAAVVIKGSSLPIIRGMTGITLGSKLSIVFIILLMTGITICGGAFENFVYMAIFTGSFGMFAFQLKDR